MTFETWLKNASTKVVNSGLVAIADSRRLRGLIEGWLVVISYSGRRTGRRFSLPVGYQRAGDTVTIGVANADEKTWWRNFLGDGAPLSLRLKGIEQAGHGVARRDGTGHVTVTVRLDKNS